MSTTPGVIKDTQIIVDLTGPIIDISQISDYHGIPAVRYLNENEIAGIMNRRYPSGKGWSGKDIIDRIIEIMDSKSKISILDKEVVELLCFAKIFADIKIISSVPDPVFFVKARSLITTYSQYIVKRNYKEIQGSACVAIDDNDFLLIGKGINENGEKRTHESLQQYLDFLHMKDNAKYRIVYDDDVDINILSKDTNNEIVKEWISGFQDKNHVSKLKHEIEKRARISQVSTDVGNLLCGGKKVNLSKYSINDDKKFNFYVFDDKVLKNLKVSIEDIKNIVSNNSDSKGEKPLCVFVAGAPGTGKTYFVKKFAAFVEADDTYPMASLSGVTDLAFENAVREHIKSVYSSGHNRGNKPHIAFLDEVDTKGGVLAFRLLMDAMTGDEVDENGICTRNKTYKLVWFFAGSIGKKRADFISHFEKDEKKVTDFFDRIHFDLELPTVDKPGQAILTFLSALDPKPLKKIKITKGVLHLFGRTLWKSARQIKTVCRVATAKCGFDWNNINLKCFEGISVSREFEESYMDIVEEKKAEKDLASLITIVYPS